MTPEFVIELGQRAVLTTLLVSAPLLGFGLLIGLIISIFQAVTQIQEMTLTFVPKIVAVFLCLFLLLPWMARILISFTVNLIEKIPVYVK